LKNGTQHITAATLQVFEEFLTPEIYTWLVNLSLVLFNQFMMKWDYISDDISSGGVTLKPHPGHFDEKNKPEERSHEKQIVLSPSVKYAGCTSYAPKHE
jgi:hypothetical protein